MLFFNVKKSIIIIHNIQSSYGIIRVLLSCEGEKFKIKINMHAKVIEPIIWEDKLMHEISFFNLFMTFK